MEALHLQSITASADCAVLQVSGEVDAYSAPQLREHVIKLIADGTRHLVVDMREVGFLDSTGLGALVGSLKRLSEHDGSLALVITAAKILTVFRTTGLVRVFTIHESVTEAIDGDQSLQTALTAAGQSSAEWCGEHDLL
ncbi:MAG TPA: STAS domain-containing protein [Streptosporangiaceae bacterium]